MSPQSSLTIRLDEDLRDDLVNLANARGTTLSDLVRDELSRLVGRDVFGRDQAVPVSLSVEQRRTLASLHEVLKHVDPDEARYHQKITDVLYEGFTGEYDVLFGHFASELGRASCKEVWDILNMFRILRFSLSELDETDRAALGDHEDTLKFAGFDGNDSLEGHMASYVDFLVKDGRWQELKERLPEIDGGNSHATTLPMYRAMLAEFAPIWSSHSRRGRDAFTLEELRKVAEAW